MAINKNLIAEVDKKIQEVNPLSCFGVSALTFPDKVSTVRGAMAARYVSQRVVLTDPEFPYVYTGAENPFGDRSAWLVTAENDYKLMKSFVKFKNTRTSPVCYIFLDLKTGKYKCELYTPAVNLVEKYGFRMHSNMQKRMEGDIIPEGTIIAQSPSYVNRNYCAGRNLRTVYAIIPEVTEDAVILSKSAADSMSYDMVDIVKVNVPKDSYLLNNYGDTYHYKSFPDIGESIKNSIVCSIRENSFLSTKDETQIPHINDKNYFSSGSNCGNKGIIVDIDIFTNIEVEDPHFNYYHSQISEWYSEIYSYISTIVSDPNQDDTSLLDIYHKAEKYLNNTTWATKDYITDTSIEFTVLHHVGITKGQKITGRYGNKSIVAAVIDDDKMWKTDDGRSIDQISNGFSLTNRIISFATYEQSMTYQAEMLHQHIVKNVKDDNKAFQLVAEFMDIYDPEKAEELRRLFRENPKITMDDIRENMIYINVIPLGYKIIRDCILEADEKFKDIFKKYKIQVPLKHRWITLPDEHVIGYQYTWVLKQEASKTMSTRSTGKTTLYDLNVKTSRLKNNLAHYSDNPLTFGEYDTLNFLAGISPTDFAKIATYFRGSQHEDNSILMSQLNNVGVDITKYNKFPQIDNLKNILKLFGVKLEKDIFDLRTFGRTYEKYKVFVNNIEIEISIPDLQSILIMNSYFLQYEQYCGGSVNMDEFFTNMLKTNSFPGLKKEKIDELFTLYLHLLPIMNQLKEY